MHFVFCVLFLKQYETTLTTRHHPYDAHELKNDRNLFCYFFKKKQNNCLVDASMKQTPIDIYLNASLVKKDRKGKQLTTMKLVTIDSGRKVAEINEH